MLGYMPLPTNTEHTVEHLRRRDPVVRALRGDRQPVRAARADAVVWVSYHVEGIRAKGAVSYLKSWIPAGVEGAAAGPIFVIEVISHFVRLISLSVRLFANILAGHLLILFMGGGLVVLLEPRGRRLGAARLDHRPMAIAFFLFEVGLVATLQAFIFATLTAIYFGGAVAESH